MDKEMTFRVGDVVTCKLENNRAFGKTGIVCDPTDGVSVGVCWDSKDEFFHDCHGKCPYGFGWYVFCHELIKVEVDVGDMEDDL